MGTSMICEVCDKSFLWYIVVNPIIMESVYDKVRSNARRGSISF